MSELKAIETRVATMDAIVALTDRVPDVDMVITVSGIELGIVVDSYSHTPASGRCAQLCETPEEYFGSTELEYSIKSIWCEEKDSYYNCVGDDLTLPDEIAEPRVYDAVLEYVQEGR